ncbi:MAG: 4'-phosphopantetheinyl transferase superfamily protein [Elusimicrobia bacterium]|nr:4'-phosphopantetheinyl transferase superfamily protein [Elusimicrobiota bacterium]
MTLEGRPYRLARAPAHEAAALVERHDAGGDISQTLAPEELVRFNELKVPKRRRDWVAGRLAVKRLVSQLLAEQGREVRPNEVAVLNRGDGSPYVVPNIRTALVRDVPNQRISDVWYGFPIPISLSHGPLGAVAASLAPCSEGYIGVDVEAVSERPEAFLSVFAHASERRGLDSPHAQTRLWTLKEAVLKLLSLGLSVDLWDVRFIGDRLELHGRALSRWEALGSPEILFDCVSNLPNEAGSIRPNLRCLGGLGVSEHEALSVAYTGRNGGGHAQP